MRPRCCPGFLLAFLYLVYIVGWAMIQPKIAPPLPEEQTRVPVPAWMRQFQSAYSPNIFFALLRALISPAKARQIDVDGKPHQSTGSLLKNFAHRAGAVRVDRRHALAGVVVRRSFISRLRAVAAVEGLQQLGSAGCKHRRRRAERGPPENFYIWYRGGRVLRRDHDRALLLESDRRALRALEDADLVGDAARHSHRRGSRRHPVRHHDRDRIRRRRRGRCVPAGVCTPARSTGSAPRKRCS